MNTDRHRLENEKESLVSLPIALFPKIRVHLSESVVQKRIQS